MLSYQQRPNLAEEAHRFHTLDRTGLSKPGLRRSSVVDISSLIESRGSPSSGDGKSAQLPALPTPATSHHVKNASSIASLPALPPTIPSHFGSAPDHAGGPVRSPPQLPPVSSLQLHPPPPPPVIPQYSQQPAYQSGMPTYYTSPPSVSAPPPYHHHHQSLPSISSSAYQSVGAGPYATMPIESQSHTIIPAKRAADSGPRTSPPPPSKKHHGKWTEEEDNLAIELRRRGMKWDDIAKRIPGRSAISCRLRYQNYSEKRPNWDEEKKNKLARLYNRFKRDMWEMVATEMGLPWRAVEAMHWQMGQEEMASRANVPVFQPHPGGPEGREGGYPDEEGQPRSPPPSGSMYTDRYGPPSATIQGLRARRSSSVSSRRALASAHYDRPETSHTQLPPLLEPASALAALGRAAHQHSQSQPQNIMPDHRYGTLPPLAPLSDPGRSESTKAHTYPTPSTAQSLHQSYPSSSSTAPPSVPNHQAAGSPAGYQTSEPYGTPSPRGFYNRSAAEERSGLVSYATSYHNRQGSQGSIRSVRSMALTATTNGPASVVGGVGYTDRAQGPGSAPNSAVGRRMSIGVPVTGPEVRRNSIALPPPR